MTATALCARRSTAAQRASWWNTPAPRPGGFRSSFPTHGPPTRGSARPSPATRRSTSSRWESPAVYGKTITALMVRSILDAAGEQFGLIGSSGFCDGTKTRALGAGFEPPRGSLGGGAASAPVALAGGAHEPDGFALGAAGLAALLAEMVDRGCKGGVVEVSSSALENRSLEGMAFDAAVVTDVAGTGASPPDDLVRGSPSQGQAVPPGRPGGIGCRERR